MPPAALKVPPKATVFCHSLQKEGSFLTADHHPKLGTASHIHGALRHHPAVERPHGGSWGLAQEAVWQRCQACPVSPAPTPEPSAVTTSHRTAGRSCSKLCNQRIFHFKCFSYCKQFTNYSSNDWIMAS